MERKLIFEDIPAQGRIVSAGIPSLINTAKVLRDKYKTLDLGDLDNETYQNIVQGGYDYIVKKMVKAIDDALIKANLTLPSVRRGALADVETRLKESKIEFPANILNAGYEYNQSFYAPKIQMSADLLTLQNGEFIVNEEKKQHLFDEHTRIYIEGEGDQSIWDNLNEFASKINAQNEFFRQIGADLIKPFSGASFIPQGATQAINLPPDTLYNLFKVDENGVLSVKPTAIGYIKGFAIRKAFTERQEQKQKEREDLKSGTSEAQERKLYGGKTIKEIAHEDMKSERAKSKSSSINQDVIIDPEFVDSIIT